MTEQENQTQRLTLDVAEAAQLLGLGRNTTYTLVRSGRLRSVRVGRRLVIPRSEVDAFLEREASKGEGE